MDTMKKSLDTYIVVIFTLILSGVLAVGGTSLFMVNRMMEKTYAIEAESRNVDFINHLHNKTYNLMLAIHHFMVRPDARYFQLAVALSDEIDGDLQKYLQHEEESAYPEGAYEIRLLQRFRDSVRKQREMISAFKELGGDTSAQLRHWDAELEKNAYAIQLLVKEINRLHFDIIARKVAKTKHSMSIVVALYLLFAAIGLALAYAGYRLHSRHIVKPIKHLAESSGKIADGDLNIRVQTDAQTEIGVLYRAFNSMLATLQSHEEKLREFNRGLEHKVRERTRELEGAYASLKAAQAKLLRLEKLAMLGQIATSVNHEIRTPLNALYMNLQLIKKALGQCRGDCNEQRDSVGDKVAIIDQEVVRISDILEEFVRYARIAPPEPKDCDLNKTVSYVADMLGPRAEQARVNLHLVLAEAQPRLFADENKLVQVLVNLGINAIHAMPEGGTLCIATADRGETVEVSVSDTGMGIPAVDIDKVFLPFFSKKESGLGFGLAIVQRIVEDHGGHISCRSQVGVGATFTAQLPKFHPVVDVNENESIGTDR